MKKRLSKILWYGEELPNPATSSDDLEGLHKGELFLHLKDDGVTLWSLSADGRVVEISGGGGGDLSQYLLKSIWDRVWEIKTDSQGNEYIFGKLPVVTQYGITMYADGGELNLPSIYAGIPFDNKTIWLNPETKKVEVIGGTGGGVADSVHWNNIEGKPLFSAVATSGKYADLSGLPDLNVYATTEYLTAELKKYVTLNTEQTIGAHKDFLNGLSIGGLPITKSQDDVIYLDANLVVRGGITMYAEGEVNIPSIIDSLPIASTTAKGIASFDGTYFAVDSNGKVTLLAANVGLNEEELAAYLTEKKYATQSWVYSLGYASSSDLNALQTKVNDFLEGSDTDTIINKWKELESFLSGLSESDNLATILGTKANQSDLDDTNEIVATKWTQDDTKINNWDNAYKWGNHADVGYALKSYVDNEFKKYVTLADDQTISGVKTFTNGLKIGTSTINQSQNDVVYIDANLVVRGGITMYSDNTVDVGTIFDALPIDGNTIYWENGVLKANITEGVITNITSDMVVGALGFTPYNASNPKGYISGITSAMVVSALGYTPLQNHQTIYALTIQKNGTNVGTYTPNSAKKTINIVVPTKVSELDNDNEYATTGDLDSRINNLINGAPAAFDTLKEIADVLQGNVNSIGDIITTLGTKADKAIKISAGTGLSGGGTLEADRTLSLATSGVTAGTYKSVTVDKYGRVTSGTNPTTLAGYGITDAYTKTKVDELLGNYVTLATKQSITGEKNFTGGLKVNGSPIIYDATNKYWKLEGNLLVTGGITMFGSDSEFKPSTIMDAITTDNVNLKVVDGVLTFVGQTGGGVADSVLWDNIEGKPSWIGSSKPSYSYSEISGTPTLLSSFTDDVVAGKYLPLSGGELSGRLDINQTSSDQPLTLRSGKADSAGACRIQFKDSSKTHQAYVMSGWGELIMAHRTGNQIGVGTTGIWCSPNNGSTKNSIYHSGNLTNLSQLTDDVVSGNYLPISTYTASDILTKLLTVDGAGSGLDADLLDGLEAGDIQRRSLSFYRAHNATSVNKTDLNHVLEGMVYNYSSFEGWVNAPKGMTYGQVLAIRNHIDDWLVGQIAWDVNHNSKTDATKNLYFRASDINGFTYSQWHTIAFTDSNVASATKLQTARTIWGQSFDGSGDVSGDLTLGNKKFILGKDSNGVTSSILGINQWNELHIGEGSAASGYSSVLYGNSIVLCVGKDKTDTFRINANGNIISNVNHGNVLIGTTTDSGYKLDVVENTADKIFKVSSSANTFRITSSSIGAYNNINGGWAIYAGSTSSESARFEVIDKNGSWTGKGWTLLKNGNIGIGAYTDNGYKLDVNGTLRATGDTTLASKLTLNGIPIYKSQDDVLYIDGNLAVRGGITMYATDAIDVPSIMDSIAVDNVTIGVNSAGALTVLGGAVSDNYASITDLIELRYEVDNDINRLEHYIDVNYSVMMNSYLPLSGGQMTGNIGYTLARDSHEVGVPSAGSFKYSIDMTTSGALFNKKSFIGSCLNETNAAWYHIISVRHKNGASDGDMYGMYISCSMLSNDSLVWNRQRGSSSWDGERVILDSVNWSDYVNVSNASGGSIIPKAADTYSVGAFNTYYSMGYFNGLNSGASNNNLWLIGGAFNTSTGIVLARSNAGQFDGKICRFDGDGLIWENGTSASIKASYYELVNKQNNPYLYLLAGSQGWYCQALNDGLYIGSKYANSLRIDASGNILTPGGITMYSDIRKKTKLQDVELSLKQIADAPLIEHYYNSDEKRTTHVGSIAQYWASMNDWFCKLDSEGYYTMEIQNAALASAISIARELVKYESKTDRKIRLLKERVKELEEKIEKLENN